MSCNYADGLSNYEDKGVLGVPERFDTEESVDAKVNRLADWILEAKHVVFHTGAGISTSAGIPDFRGPNGVWTLEKKGLKPNINISFDDAAPTKTHMALIKLVEEGYVKFIVSQNIDGLHLKSGLDRNFISELHGNIFTEKCNTCDRQFVRNTATTTVGQKCLEKPCPAPKNTGRACRGKLHDTILDWEDNLPAEDLDAAYYHSHLADLNICLGTTLQIVPSGNLPLNSKKYNGRLVIVNLQPTKHDSKANLIINAYIDDLMKKLMKKLSFEIPEYCREKDPTKSEKCSSSFIEWTLSPQVVKKIQKMYDEKCKGKRKRKSVKDSPRLTKAIKIKKKEENEIKNDVKQEIKNEVKQENEIKTEVNEIKTEVNEIKTEVNEINTEVNEINTEVNAINIIDTII